MYLFLIIGILFFAWFLIEMEKNGNGNDNDIEYFATCAYSDCKSCASASGCSWCPATNQCMLSSSLKGSDAECNSLNTITSFDQCTTSVSLPEPEFYSNAIEDRVKPPNVFQNKVESYSPETVMGHLHHIQHRVDSLFQQLPYCMS